MEMKKEYFKPQIKFILDADAALLSGSVGGDVDDNPEIGYGGTDENGGQDPDAKPFTMHDVWDD